MSTGCSKRSSKYWQGQRSLEDLRKIEPKARQIYMRYLNELDGADVKDLAIHRRVSRLDYSRICAEAWRCRPI